MGGLASDQEEIGEAITRLPERQREALELLECERLPYGEIAARLGTSRDSVAQLISRARINLYDELRGTPLASIAAPPECERALPLIAAREDGQIDADAGGDAVWLDAHLAGCDRCRPAVEQMADAAASYRAWATPGGSADSQIPQPVASGPVRPRRRQAVFVAASMALVLLVGLAAAFVRDDGTRAPAEPATGAAASEPSGGESASRVKVADVDGRKGNAKTAEPVEEADVTIGQDTAGEAAPTVIDSGSSIGGGPSEHPSGPNQSSGKTAVDSPKQISAPKPSRKPKPAPNSTPAQPTPAPGAEAPAPAVSPTAQESPDAPGRSGEAPGKPADRPPRK